MKKMNGGEGVLFFASAAAAVVGFLADAWPVARRSHGAARRRKSQQRFPSPL
jgi:hypothetical protein